ncbi:LamG domain-containing protein [Glycomyces sp. YM15]|uniref:LamG domain-containing protein n=1 Tax=Glycomyces sp. YM15 TaxID=2800446 RepID=UPI0019661B3E|nr:LamG domain-containing protein [Glycomyces sp. YM15]
MITDENGLISAAAVPGGVTVSSGGDAQPLASLTTEDGGTLDLWWPQPLPEPVLDGALARYGEVFDGVDLLVEASATGFAYQLEVKTPEAAGNPELAQIDVELGGTLEVTQDAATDALAAIDPATGEVVLAANNALMWDSSIPASADIPAAGPTQGFAAALAETDTGSDIDPGDPGRVEEMDVRLDGKTLAITPDAGMLTDPATVFPIVIDPSFESTINAWATVGSGQYADSTWWDDAAWPRSGGLRMGFNGWAAPGEEGYGVWRSMIRFDLSKLNYATVSAATMSLTLKHTGGCDSYPLELWQTNIISKGTTPTSWNSTAGKWLHGAPLDTKTVASANAAGGCSVVNPTREVNFASEDLTYHVNRHANVPYQSITLGLKTADEANREQWVRADVATAHLTLSYQPTMAVPSDLTVNGTNCLAPAGARVSGTLPTFSAVPTSSDGEANMSFWVRNAAGTTVAEHISPTTVPSGMPYEWQAETELTDGVYEVRARANTTDGVSARYTTWCAFEVDSTMDTLETVATTSLECPYDLAAGEVPESFSEGGALLLAEACGVPVTVTGMADYDTQVTADPAGFLTAEVETVPAWAPDASGDWVEVDTSFTETAEGAITTVAAVSDITVSTGGDGPFVTATSPEGGTVALTWPGTLPVPVIAGDTATYAEVLAGVDLQVTSNVDGFTYALIVKNAEARDNPALASIDIGISSEGLTVAQDANGAVVATDAAGETVFTAPGAFMWDASLDPDGAAPEAFAAAAESEPVSELGPDDAMPGLYADVDVALTDGTLTVTPDPAVLSDPDAQFPITIDPPFVGSRLAWANIFKSRPSSSWTNDKDWPRQGGMRVGLNIWASCAPDACGLWRSAVRFDIDKLDNKDILTAKVAMTQTHSGGCGSADLALYDVNRKLSNGTTWNSITSASQEHLQTKSVASSNATGCSTNYPDRDINFDTGEIKSRLQSRVNAGTSWMSFMVRSSDEGDPYAWRRIDIKSVELQVTYNTHAGNPTSLKTNGKDCNTAGYTSAPWTTEIHPSLSGIPHDADGKVGARIEIRQKGSTNNVRTWSTTRNQTDGARQTWVVPKNQALPSGEYRWRMQSLDNYASGSDNYTDYWCYFRIDTTSPVPATVELVSPANPQAGQEVTFKVTSRDAHSGLAGFRYGLDAEVPAKYEPASNGSATIKVTAPASGGRVWLYVWAEDKAGNKAQRTQADFYAPRTVAPAPAAAWRLDGDGFDDAWVLGDNTGTDSGTNHDLNMGRTSGWVDSGAETPPGQAMLFGGTDCVSTEGAVIDTSTPYTVAAWVRTDTTDTNIRTILSQSGEHMTGFALRYRGASQQWDLMLNPSDTADTSSVVRASSTTAPVLGDWTHLAATVDPGSKVIQLWVDGALQATRSFEHEAWNATGPVNIGCNSRTDTNYQNGHFKGAIQHVGIWTGLLTDANVKTVMAGDLPAGLAGEWLMRGDADDSSMQANHLTVPAGADWSQDDQWGRKNSAINLDGTSCVTAGDAAQNHSDASFSVAAWVRPDTVNTTSEQIVFGEGGGEYYKFKLRMWTDGKWGVSLGTGPTGTGTQNVTAPTVATLGEWTHLAAVYDAVNSTMNLFVNGVSVASRTVTFTPWDGFGKLNIGCRGNASGSAGGGYFDGAISTAQLWRGAITAEQVAEAYGGNPAADRQGNWPFDRNMGTIDSEGGHNLTVNGTRNTDYRWGQNKYGCSTCSLQLMSDNAWAQTTGPVVRTDASFTIATRVWIDARKATDPEPEWQTIMSQAGNDRVGFNLNSHYYAATGERRFQFAMPSVDTGSTVTWHKVEASVPIVTGQWYHVAVVVDIPAGTMTMYIDGDKAATGTGTSTPWNATGPFYLGAHGRVNVAPAQQLRGRIDDVQVWTSTVDPDRIGDMSRTNGS